MSQFNRTYVGLVVGALVSLLAQAALMGNWDKSGSIFGEFLVASFWHQVSFVQLIASVAFCGLIGFMNQRKAVAKREEQEMLDYMKEKTPKKQP